jgi:mannose-6-phosphate isomerase-like protein (cupin superfamily)
MSAPFRRIVTGHTAGGKSTIVADGQPPSDAGAPDRYLWTTGATPADNRGDADAAAMPLRLEPPANGSVFRLVEFPPQSAMAGLSIEQKRAFFRKLFAGMDATHCQVDTTRSPGMHKTRTVDYVVVVRGEITLLLDEAEATLKPGDVVVQRGTNHDWVVRGNEPALLAVVMISARPV